MLARDDEFAIVVVLAGDTADSLAQLYLGDARKAWWITEGNGGAEIRPGQVVVIPLVPRNRVGVHADGFQVVPVLCYHRFGSRASKLTVTPAAFSAQMDYLARNGYHAVTLAQLAGFRRRARDRAPEEKRRDHDRRRLPRDLRHRVSDPQEIRLSRHRVPVHRLRRRRRRAHLPADEGADRVRSSSRSSRTPRPTPNLTLRLADETDARISRPAAPRGRRARRLRSASASRCPASRTPTRTATSTRPSSTSCRARASRSA